MNMNICNRVCTHCRNIDTTTLKIRRQYIIKLSKKKLLTQTYLQSVHCIYLAKIYLLFSLPRVLRPLPLPLRPRLRPRPHLPLILSFSSYLEACFLGLRAE